MSRVVPAGRHIGSRMARWGRCPRNRPPLPSRPMVELRGTAGSWSAPDASGRGSGGSFDADGIVPAQRLLEAMDGHCVLILDGRGRLTAASDRAVEVLGDRVRAMVGHSPARVFSHSYVFETLLALAATMSPVEHHDDIILDGGDTVRAVVSASAMGPVGERPAGYALFFCADTRGQATAASGNGNRNGQRDAVCPGAGAGAGEGGPLSRGGATRGRRDPGRPGGAGQCGVDAHLAAAYRPGRVRGLGAARRRDPRIVLVLARDTRRTEARGASEDQCPRGLGRSVTSSRSPRGRWHR